VLIKKITQTRKIQISGSNGCSYQHRTAEKKKLFPSPPLGNLGEKAQGKKIVVALHNVLSFVCAAINNEK
jgi:hypothetical protein